MDSTNSPVRLTENNSERDVDYDDGELTSLGTVDIIESDNLDETVLGAAAVGIPEIPPEVTEDTKNLTVWDESADSGKTQSRDIQDDGTMDVERLIEAGIEEADRELRLVANPVGEE